MQTLHEFSLTTQAWEYIFGLLTVILFIPFWKWVNAPQK
jgi:hypothetical protein